MVSYIPSLSIDESSHSRALGHGRGGTATPRRSVRRDDLPVVPFLERRGQGADRTTASGEGMAGDGGRLPNQGRDEREAVGEGHGGPGRISGG